MAHQPREDVNSRCYPVLNRTLARSYLILRVTLENQHIHHGQLLYKPMPLELLSYFCPKRGYGHIKGVHLLNLGRL